MMRLRDAVFQQAFQRLFVYNILFEDAEVDERYLDMKEDSTVLSISGAGCGVAGMVSRQPRSIDAVDINQHHLALAGLRTVAARHLRPYGDFYDLLGRGWQPDPKRTISQLSRHMPSWMAKYWARHHTRFQRSLYREGLTATMMSSFRRVTGLDASWLRWAATLPPEERVRAVEEWIGPVLRSPLARAYLTSPAQLVALGINFSQRDRILETEREQDLADFILAHLKRLALTEVTTNWFVWWAIAGHYDHERQDAVPPYLRADRHTAATEATTELRFHHRNLFDILDEAKSSTWSHYTLCDAPDWMSPQIQQKLLDGIHRTSRDGAIVLYRSVEDEGMVERLGLEKRFIPLTDKTERATEEDRSRMYRKVRFYQVAH